MASIIVDFEDGSHGRADVLQISFQFEESELNRTFLAKIDYRINGPGPAARGPWQYLDEDFFITAEEPSMMIECKPSISPNSPFQQRVQFKVVLFGLVLSQESGEWVLHR